jgi:Mg2+-importing ATPase
MSSSFGNVLSLAIAANFMKFIPMLPAQLLLIDTLSDVQHLSMATDNVDEEAIHKPRNWDMPFLIRFMVLFGALSSITDFILIYLMLQMNPSPELFRTMWFLVAAIEEILATFSIRTKTFFFKSKPSLTLIIVSLLTIVASIIITVITFVPNIFGFVRLDSVHWVIVFVAVFAYLIVLEIAKLLFYKYFNKKK